MKSFRIEEGAKVDLKKWPTLVDPLFNSKKEYRKLLARHIDALGDQQNLLYAANSYALLLIFQGMDASGKDGAIKHVMSGINPQGCEVTSFKHPSEEELDHDFLWRTTCRLPARGRIGIFNRSYYEEVLIARVHPAILRAERISSVDEKDIWRNRYRSIIDLERHLHSNGTVVVKFFLHLSKQEQRKRFLSRLEDPNKNWKFSLDDLHERKYWNQYAAAYEECLSATSTTRAPWYVVPADDKLNARLIVSQLVLDTIDSLKLSYPKPDPKRLKELKAIRKQLAAE